MIEICTLGLSLGSGNKGCEALAYSFLELLEDIAAERNEIIKVNFLKPFPTRQVIKKHSVKKTKSKNYPQKSYEHLRFDCKYYLNKKQKIFFINSIKSSVCVFDYTDGDSFTDIYGQERFFSRTAVKKAVIDKGIPLILGSQTIGPFNDTKVRKLAVEVIKNSAEVYVRDRMSCDYTKKISGRTPKLTSHISPICAPIRAASNSCGISPEPNAWNTCSRFMNTAGLPSIAASDVVTVR